MNDVYAIVAAALEQDAMTFRSVSQNVSNLSTPGYKREVPYQQAFGTLFEATRQNDPYNSNDMNKSTMAAAPHVVYDASKGSLKNTGRALDVAIVGDGYFEIQLDDGPAYTRQGNFRLDTEGRLVTERGDAVMGDDGEIVLATDALSISDDGEVKDGDRAIGYLKIADLGDTTNAEHVAPGLIRAAVTAEALEGTKRSVRQGYLENSNVSLASEMVQMMQTLRHFESVQRVAQQYDDLIGNSIRKLGEG